MKNFFSLYMFYIFLCACLLCACNENTEALKPLNNSAAEEINAALDKNTLSYETVNDEITPDELTPDELTHDKFASKAREEIEILPVIPVEITESKSIIIPLGNDIENNGGYTVKYGDCVYFCSTASIPDDFNSKSGWALYVMKENGNEKFKLADTDLQNKLYIIDQYIVMTEYGGATYKINSKTGIKELFFNGSLENIDYESREIYYSTKSMDLKSGIYKISFDGLSTKTLCSNDYMFLGMQGDLIYLGGPHINGSGNAVLYVMNKDSGIIDTKATIPSLYKLDSLVDVLGKKQIIYDWIIDFGFYKDSMVLCVGNYELVSGGYFSGGLFKLNMDGTEPLVLNKLNHTDKFLINNEYIYFNISDKKPSNCFRISIETNIKEDISKEVGFLHNTSVDGWLFYDYPTGIKIGEKSENPVVDLRMCDVGINNISTLFTGSTALFNDSYFISYYNVEPVGDYVYFYIIVLGYNEAAADDHIDHYGYYKVKKDGSGLTLLNADMYLKCPYDGLK